MTARRGERFSEHWDAVLRAMPSRTFSGAVKSVGTCLSKHADWHTGEDVYVGPERIALECGVTERNARAYRKRLIDAGWLVWSGKTKGHAKNYTLTVPPGVEGVEYDPAKGVESDPVSNHAQDAKGVECDPVRGVESDPQPHQTPRDDEEEEASGPRLAPRPSPQEVADAVAFIISTVTGPSGAKGYAGTSTHRVHSARLVSTVGDLLAEGWSPAHLAARAVTVGTAHTNPAGLLAKHLSRIEGSPTDPEPVQGRLAALGVRDVGHLAGLLDVDLSGLTDGMSNDAADAAYDAPLFTAGGTPSRAVGVSESLAALAEREAEFGPDVLAALIAG